MEAIWYYFLFFISIIYCIDPSLKKNEILSFIFWFTLASITSLIVRNAGFDSDIQVYYQLSLGVSRLGDQMPIQFGPDTWNQAFNREPVIYFLLKYLPIFTEDKIKLFFIMDMIAFLILYFALRNFEKILENETKNIKNANLSYIYFGILVLFAFVFHMQATYRQHFASLFTLLSISLILLNNWKSYLALIFGILSHNAAGLFLPTVFIFQRNIVYRLVFILVILIFPIIFLYFTNSKQQYSIGENIGYLYNILFLLMSIFCFVIYQNQNTDFSRKIFYSILYITYVIFISNLLSETNIVERISLYSIVIVFPLIAMIMEIGTKNGTFLLRIALITFGFFVTLYQYPIIYTS